MKPHLYRYSCAFLLLCFSVISSYPLFAAESPVTETIPTTAVSFTTTFENLTLPQGEKMGFLGGSYYYSVSEHISLGPAAYGAVTGERGGFITLGGTAEYSYSLGANYELNSGLFVGAGGGRGGYLLTGGGLMLRYHAGINYKTSHSGRFGVGASYVDFPDGSIHSTQTYLSYAYPFRTLIASGWLAQNNNMGEALSTTGHELATVYKMYTVPSGIHASDGTTQYPRIDLAGIEWNKSLSSNFFLHSEADGAMGGKSNGYMQLLLGGGYRYPLYEQSAIRLSGSLGVAGGGGVATGGGLLLDTQLSYQHYASEHLYVAATGGYVYAPDGDFKARSLGLTVGYAFDTPYIDADALDFDVAALAGFDIHHCRIRAAQQRYLIEDPNWRALHNDYDVETLGIQMDAFMDEYLFLSGQSLAAYSGEAGAYMTGLLGAGVHIPISNAPLFFDGEVLVGAAGGGGVSVGGGYVWQSNLGLGYQLSNDFSLITQYGRMEAPHGTYKANVVTLSLAYQFSLFTK